MTGENVPMDEPSQPDGDAGEVRPTDPRLRRLEDLSAGNRKTVESLQREGVVLSGAGMRLEVLIDAIFTDDDKVEFELRYEEALAASLEQARQQIVRAKLTQGINGARPR